MNDTKTAEQRAWDIHYGLGKLDPKGKNPKWVVTEYLEAELKAHAAEAQRKEADG